jgi:hypothetical protein
MSINQGLAGGALGVPATSLKWLEDIFEAAFAGLGRVTEAPPARGNDVVKLAAACGGDVTEVAAADHGDVAEAGLVGGGDVARASDGGDDIESPTENSNKNETEVTFFLFWRLVCHCYC